MIFINCLWVGALAGLVGKEPATVDPLFLDAMIVKPEQNYPVKLGDKTFNLSLADIVYDAVDGNFPHPNTMTCKLMAGDQVLKELSATGLPNLWIPDKEGFVQVDEIPLLGTGKLDLQGLRNLVEERVLGSTGAARG